jgi:hypothetical protein
MYIKMQRNTSKYICAKTTHKTHKPHNTKRKTQNTKHDAGHVLGRGAEWSAIVRLAAPDDAETAGTCHPARATPLAPPRSRYPRSWPFVDPNRLAFS